MTDAAASPPPPGSAMRTVERWRGGQRTQDLDHVAEEVPVALFYNAHPFAVMMATPTDLEDFALGFTLSEGIAAEPEEVDVEGVVELLEGIELRIRLPAARQRALARRRRNLSGRSGCGLCGNELLETSLRRPAVVAAGTPIAAEAVHLALDALRQAQALNRLTGATHAAAWAEPGGRLLAVREDVGRHNALDKLIGAMVRARHDPRDGFAVVTSRASYEMAMKAASAGIGLLAAISAPTALAISLAQATGLTLVGFARDGDHAVYSHPARLLAARDR